MPVQLSLFDSHSTCTRCTQYVSRVLACAVSPSHHALSAHHGVLGVQILDVQLRQMGKARGTVCRTEIVLRQPRRDDRGPRAAGRPGASVLPPVRRETVLRHVRGSRSVAGPARPAAGAHRDGQGFRFVLRQDREQRVVRARQVVRSPGERTGRTVEVDQSEVESDLHRGQTQVHDDRHKRMHVTTNSQLEWTSDDEQWYLFFLNLFTRFRLKCFI